jgi:hypothetical protein
MKEFETAANPTSTLDRRDHMPSGKDRGRAGAPAGSALDQRQPASAADFGLPTGITT